jgi:tRNA(Arg) A34 adenosine deaminase TadA
MSDSIRQEREHPGGVMQDREFLRRAIELAETHSKAGLNGPFGAVVVRGGEIVGKGWNRVVEDADPTAHAEMEAIREASRTLGTHDLNDCSLYCSCEPCPMCLSAVYWSRIQRVVFAASVEDAAEAGFDDARILTELARSWTDRKVEAIQDLRDVGRTVLRAWAQNPRRVEY